MVKVLFFYHKRRSKMSYKLVIAEKPSVAQSIAKVTVTASIMKKKYVPIALNRHMYATDAVK